ncbi:MAG TPA: PEP-CTERM sorting domain-containing protein [Rhodocyclaceae bacterium]|nr:PEP-CTERM sorting domain-containing protein [Rhodocyclaceae bacterium]
MKQRANTSWGAKAFGPLLVIGLMQTATASAAITVSTPYHFLDNRSDNSVRLLAGVRQAIGATSVTPNPGTEPSAETELWATQDGENYIDLVYDPVTVAPNQYSRTVASGSQLYNASTGTFAPYTPTTNGWTVIGRTSPTEAFSDVATLPSIVGAAPLPFVSNMRIGGSGADTTFEWGVYEASSHDSVRVQIWSLDYKPGDSISGDIIFSRNFLTPDAASFRVGDYADLMTLLDPAKMYSVEVSLIDRRNDAGSLANSNILSRSRSFFDFMLLPEGGPTAAYLPSGGIDPSGETVFKFKVEDVSPDEIIFIDPLVAVGYDYAIGEGDPLFRSILLPAGIGDSLYDLYIWNGGDWVLFQSGVVGGTELDLGEAGVDRIRVLGIEAEAGLDPANPLAFITGLRFTDEGRFTGTMTPITFDTGTVPEPAMLLLLATALLAIRLAPQVRRARR